MIRFVVAALAILASCAQDDPIKPPADLHAGGAIAIVREPYITTTTTSTTTTTTTTTTITTTTTTTTTLPPKKSRVDRPVAPAEIRQVVESLWGPEYERALDVAWCESRFDLQAQNPTSSASGLFQLLAPWTREPGTGRSVWGWEFTDDGEKLSAAAGLGISEQDARLTIRNAEVAYEIYRRAGSWRDWNASKHCWR